jgi:hypothetical protein
MRKRRKQNGGSAAEAQRRIDMWIAEGDVTNILHLNELKLTSLPPIPDDVKFLSCHSNKLTSLPTLPSDLQELSCENNKLTNLPTLPEDLEILACGENNLMSLPTLPSGLQELYCHDNNLMSLQTLPSGLQKLSCDHTKLRSLPSLPSGLKSLFCSDNKLTTLPSLPSSLERLSCENNKLPEIYYRLPEDEGEGNDHHLNYIERIRHLQKTKGNQSRNLKSHNTESKRKKFALNLGTHKNNPLHRFAMKNIANFMDEANLKNFNTNSMKPSNVEFNANKNAARKRLATRKKKYHK